METLSTADGNFTITTVDSTDSTAGCPVGTSYIQVETPLGQVYGKTKEEHMRGLFRVFAVDPKEDKSGQYGLLVDRLVVAKDEAQAILKALTASTVKVDLEKHDVHAFCYGMFIRTKKEVQKVEMVKEEDD